MKTIVLDAAKIRENPSEEWSSLTAMKGESAYEIAVRRGYQGTEQQWINALETERAAAVESIQSAGATTIASIPNDYTTLTNNVSQLSEEIGWLMFYQADLAELGIANKVPFSAKSGDTVTVSTKDGTDLTVGNIFFLDADGNQISYWGLAGHGSQRTVVMPSDRNDIFYAYINGGTAQAVIVTNLSSNGYNVRYNKQNKMFNVSISPEFITGKANADGTFSTRSDTRYVKRQAIGVNQLKITSGYWSTPKVVFYDSAGNVISVVNGQTGNNTTTAPVPDGAYEYTANVSTDYADSMIVIEEWDAEKKLVDASESLVALEADANRRIPALILPTFYPAVVGHQSYLYYENVLANAMLKDYTLTNDSVFSTNECLMVTPSASGDTTQSVLCYANRDIILSATTICRAVSKDTSGSAKILIIGDSKSAAVAPWDTLYNLLSDDNNVSFTFFGQVTSGHIAREAYSGKDIINLCDDEYISGSTANIFYDVNTTTTNNHHFSYAKGVSAIGDTPDIVIIDYGANMWADSWATVKGCYDDVIASIKAVNPSTKIVVVVQEGTGLKNKTTYKTDGKWWLWNPNYTNAQKILTEYRDRESENIYIMPTFICVDLYNDFPICALPRFAGANGERDFCMDDIHPGLNASAWSSSTSYKYGDWIARNGNGYGCKKANTNVDPETDNGTYWAKCENLNDGYIKKGQMYYYMLKYLCSLN